jgi:hypothetical protein
MATKLMARREIMEALVETGDMERGTIEGFRGSWMSGLGYLIINGHGVPCDNGATVRALESAFGGVIAEGHTVNREAIEGKEVFYSTDFMGVLEGFTPVMEEDLNELIKVPVTRKGKLDVKKFKDGSG